MTLAPVWRTRIAAGAAGLAAVWLGSGIAQQELAGASLCIAICGAAIVMAINSLPISTLLLGGVIFGYIVGNRGFAQLSFTSSLPLLPAEIVLVTSCTLLVVRSAMNRTLPLRRDALNFAVLLWITVSSMRLYPDIRLYGFTALRDYATVYYGAFFFLGQHAAASLPGRRFLHQCLLCACGMLLVVFPLFVLFPDLFLSTLTFRGAPIIFFKGDLAGTFMAVGAVLFFATSEVRRSRAALACSLALAGGAIATNNRASMLGLIAATALMAVAGRWRFAFLQTLAAIAASIAMLFAAYLRNESWQTTRVYGAYERVLSLADPQGKRDYTAEDAASKGDNNLFRAVWWRLVYEETMSTSPMVGLGFGHDLAERFVREYYPEMDDFTVRSPHNILITIFARTGVVGLIPFLLIVGVVARRSVQAVRRDLANGALWCAATAILVSALFGVVLEGPMGAVVFWSMLGMANAGYAEPAIAPSDETVSEHLPIKETRPELAPTP